MIIIPLIMENRMENIMENEMQSGNTDVILGYKHSFSSESIQAQKL